MPASLLLRRVHTGDARFMADDPDYERRLAAQAVRIFADEWVLAISNALDGLPVGSAARFQQRIVFLRGVGRLQDTHTHPIRFMQILKALANRILVAGGDLQNPLCEIFTYFMHGHPNPAAYAGFDFYAWMNKHRAG